MAHEKVQQQLVREFFDLLSRTDDSSAGIYIFLDFLSMTLRHKASVPPTTEFVTVLKKNKPVLFGYLKKSISRSSQLHFVIQLEMDYELAMERLQRIVKGE